jgi:multidrug transporter EmrE-like cation transporter
MAGWAFVVLSSFCSVLIAHLLKVTEYKKLSTVKVLTVNYVVASLVAFFSPVGSAEFVFNLQDATPALILAIFVGFIFIANFFIYSKSVSKNGVGISVAAMRMSLLIPVLLSTFWYMEQMTSMQWIGFATVIVALFLLLPNKRRMLREPKSAAWLLVLLFLGTGLGDGSLKIFEVDFSSYLTKEQFMGTVFLSATVIGFIAVSIQKDFKFTLREIGMGILVGIPNLYSAIFLIQALEIMNGAVVYSVVNTLTVLGATVLGMIRWGDIVTPAQWAGIIATILSILLLM